MNTSKRLDEAYICSDGKIIVDTKIINYPALKEKLERLEKLTREVEQLAEEIKKTVMRITLTFEEK